jgi:hypothetical protein
MMESYMFIGLPGISLVREKYLANLVHVVLLCDFVMTLPGSLWLPCSVLSFILSLDRVTVSSFVLALEEHEDDYPEAVYLLCVCGDLVDRRVGRKCLGVSR